MEGTDITASGGSEDRRSRGRRGRQQSAVPAKDVRIRPGSEEHEYEFKLRHIRRFIDEGYRVRVTLRPERGRSTRTGLAVELLDEVRADLEDVAQVESGPDSAGGTPTMILTPLER